MRKCTLLALAVILCCASLPVLAGITFTEFGGAKQIWLTADSFTQRSSDPIAGPQFVPDAAALNTLQGQAYNFPQLDENGIPKASSPLEALDWWVQYEIPQALVPAGWGSLNGTSWGFYARTQNNIANSVDSDFLIVRGHASDLTMANPTDAQWLNAATITGGTATSLDDRILNGLAPNGLTDNLSADAFIAGEATYGGWGWWSDSIRVAPEVGMELRTKTFMTFADGKVIFRIYEREAGSGMNGLINGIVWVSAGSNYTPNDTNFLGREEVVPEPSSLAALLMGLPALLAIRRRR